MSLNEQQIALAHALITIRIGSLQCANNVLNNLARKIAQQDVTTRANQSMNRIVSELESEGITVDGPQLFNTDVARDPLQYLNFAKSTDDALDDIDSLISDVHDLTSEAWDFKRDCVKNMISGQANSNTSPQQVADFIDELDENIRGTVIDGMGKINTTLYNVRHVEFDDAGASMNISRQLNSDVDIDLSDVTVLNEDVIDALLSMDDDIELFMDVYDSALLSGKGQAILS